MRSLNPQRLATLAVLALALPSAAQAATIYDNGAPDQAFGTAISEFLVAEDFSVAADVDVANLRFWSLQPDRAAYSGSIYWAIFDDAAGEPGALVQGGVTANVAPVATGNLSAFGYEEFRFDIPVAFMLQTGSYWLGLHNGPLNAVFDGDMLWGTTAIPAGSEGLYDDAGSWIGTGNEHAFLIEGSGNVVVPEPGSLALLFGGLLFGGLLRRR